jgi:hypothetical protein
MALFMVAGIVSDAPEKTKRLATHREVRGALPFRPSVGIYDCVKTSCLMGSFPHAAVLKSGETDDRPWLGSKLDETPLRVPVTKTDPRRRIIGADI